jgi:OmpA-OmpF porin, OOP family
MPPKKEVNVRLPKILLLLALTWPLAACSTYSLQELKTATPKGTPFQAALAIKYLKYAEEEAANYDWVDSSYFADKGLAAAYGTSPVPEEFSRWNIEDDKREALEKARERLMTALQTGAAEQQPEAAADAQYRFDCWMENQDEGWRQDEIDWCKEGFAEAIHKLSGGGTKPTVEEAAMKPLIPAKEAYIVFFGSGRAGLDEKGQRMVDGVVEDLKKNENQQYVITLNGHTDTAGGGRYNSLLSRKRAQAVLNALVERGVPKMLIRAFGFGETDPKVATKDGVPEPKNRRVEIFVGG